MITPRPPVIASVVQVGSIAFATPAKIEKLGDFIAAAKRRRAELVVFPEAFIGGHGWLSEGVRWFPSTSVSDPLRHLRQHLPL
jgi:predicted amidohydrolase